MNISQEKEEKQGDILVVDDVPENLRLLSEILKMRGYKVRRVINGKMALKAAQSACPDLILLDILMPDINGYEVCQQLKSDPKTCEVPVIFLTALDDVSDKVKGFEVGGADYITKPFHVQEVLARVENQLTIVRQKQLLSQQNARLSQEICAREQAELAVKSQEQFLRAVIDTNPNLIFVKDWEGRYILVNQALANVCGTTVAELTGKTDADLNPKQHHLEGFFEDDREVMLTLQEKVISKQPVTLPDGEVRWFQTIKKALLDQDGKVGWILGVATDITERQIAEENLWVQTEQERLLRSIVQQIRQSLNLEEILNTTVTKVRQFLRANRAIVCRKQVDNSYQVVVEAVETGSTSMLGTVFQDAWLSDLASKMEKSSVLDIWEMEDLDTASIPTGLKNLLQSWEVKSQVVIPILFGTESKSEISGVSSVPSFAHQGGDDKMSCCLWGLLVAQQCREIRGWQTWEMDFLCSLAAQISIAIQQGELHSRLEAANLELQRLSDLDGLTALANRRRFDEYLSYLWLLPTQQKHSLSLILCDVDFFKLYNDRYGHLCGDECLQQIAKAIEQSLSRPTALAARYGGEEFTVILPDTDREGALEVALEIQRRVNNLKRYHAASPVSDYVTISVGVATTVPTPDIHLNALIETADRAMYQAKNLGRNQVVCLEFESQY